MKKCTVFRQIAWVLRLIWGFSRFQSSNNHAAPCGIRNNKMKLFRELVTIIELALFIEGQCVDIISVSDTKALVETSSV